MLGIDRVAHVKGAVDVAIMEGWGIRPSEIVEPDDVPDFDDKYLFVQRYRLPRLASFAVPKGQEIVGVWVIGFASIRVGAKTHGEGALGIGTLERPRKKAFVLTFWPTDLFGNWQSDVRVLAERFEVSAVVPMSTELGMGLHLYDPNLTLALPDTFFARTLLF